MSDLWEIKQQTHRQSGSAYTQRPRIQNHFPKAGMMLRILACNPLYYHFWSQPEWLCPFGSTWDRPHPHHSMPGALTGCAAGCQTLTTALQAASWNRPLTLCCCRAFTSQNVGWIGHPQAQGSAGLAMAKPQVGCDADTWHGSTNQCIASQTDRPYAIISQHYSSLWRQNLDRKPK